MSEGEGDSDGSGERFEALDAKALARRMGVSRATAYRQIEALRARQGVPGILRVQFAPAVLGFGAVRMKFVVLWPVFDVEPGASSNDNATVDNDNAAEHGELIEGDARPGRGRRSRSRRRGR